MVEPLIDTAHTQKKEHQQAKVVHKTMQFRNRPNLRLSIILHVLGNHFISAFYATLYKSITSVDKSGDPQFIIVCTAITATILSSR